MYVGVLLIFLVRIILGFLKYYLHRLNFIDVIFLILVHSFAGNVYLG